MTFSAFIEKWSASSGAERANKDLFFAELCDVLGVPRPNPVTGDAARDTYVFEKDVPFRHADGKQTTRKIDVYRHGAFLLEAKQGSTSAGAKVGTARRDTDAWNVAMQDALGQALGYARCIDDPPPFLVVADIGYCFDLYACFDRSSVWSPFPNAQHRRIHLRDLEAHADTLRAVFTDPHTLDPSKRSARVTREVATHLAELAAHLEHAGHPQELVAQFLMRCLFTMFAEDVGLLPERVFTESIEKFWLPSPASFPGGIEQLWRTMNDGGDLFLVGKILRFNGGLFRGASALPLDRDGLARLLEAAKCDWSAVEPAIFGTLLERALDAKERHRLGAHYTPRAYVERLVRPTIEEPLRAEWDLVRAEVHRLVGKSLDGEGRASKKSREKAAKLVREFHRKLCGLRVLDPACGSGNFLYVTLDLFMRIESECLALLADLGEKQELLGLQTVRVNPGQFLGIEVKPWAKEIADLVLWIGFLLWHFRAYKKDRWDFEPVLSEYGNIACRDAVLAYDREELVRDPTTGAPVSRWDGETMKAHPVTGLPVPDESVRTPIFEYVNPRRAEWPRADFIVGNPPFLGGWRLRQLLGDGYSSALRSVYPEIPEKADFVMYWWHLAAQRIASGAARRFGLITTNSISQLFQQRVVAEHLNGASPIRLVFAIPDHPWTDDVDSADVRVAMTVACPISDASPARFAVAGRVSSDEIVPIDVRSVERIGADLRPGTDITNVRALNANRGIVSAGVQLYGSGFILDEAQALALGASEHPSTIRPYLNGRDLMQSGRTKFVIDFFGMSEAEARAAHPEALQHVLLHVKPERDHNRRPSIRELWWRFGWERPVLRAATKGLSRFIVTPETSKHRIFTFLDAKTLPDNMLTVIASDDPFVLGVLSSSAHVTWSLAAGGRLGIGNDPRYTKARCFDPFPFPDASPTHRAKIGELAERLDNHRKSRKSQDAELTLTGMYNVRAKLRAGEPLTPKEKRINESGLVALLARIHDELDVAVFDAYGIPPAIDEEALLGRLVDLNRERGEEEKRGTIRWLRAAFQNSGTVSAPSALDAPEQDDAAPDDEGASAAADKPGWPKALPDQLSAVRSEIRSIPAPFGPGDVAARFAGANRADVSAALDCLAALGFVLRLGAGGEESFGAVG